MTPDANGKTIEQQTLEQLNFVSGRLDTVSKQINDADARARRDYAHIKEATLPKEHFRKRTKQMIFWALFFTLIGFVVHNATITKCFLTPAQTGWEASTCSILYPGYKDARAQSEKNLKSFQEILAGIPQNKARIEELERKTATLP